MSGIKSVRLPKSGHMRCVDPISRSRSSILILVSKGGNEPLAGTGSTESHHHLKNMLPVLDSTHSRSHNRSSTSTDCHCFDLPHHNPPLLTSRPRTDSSHAKPMFPSGCMRNPPSRFSCFPSPNFSIHSANVTKNLFPQFNQPCLTPSIHSPGT